MLWIITATITKKTPAGEMTTQIPTFYLHGDVQGIVNAEHAKKIANTIINPFNEHVTHLHAEESSHVL